jgi:hypothetical protein
MEAGDELPSVKTNGLATFVQVFYLVPPHGD